jgi:aminoglycoside phosphotransferase family enzyme/predicted kinase
LTGIKLPRHRREQTEGVFGTRRGARHRPIARPLETMNATPALLRPEALLREAALGHALREPRVVETHISWVLLTGEFAYKIHKPVSLPFLDFTSLDARLQDCRRELELNRRWAPGLYLEVVPVFGPLDAPRLTGGGVPVDYAVKMRQFPQQARLDRVAARGELDPALADQLADVVADLHRDAPCRPPQLDHGSPGVIAQQVLANLELLESWRGVRDPEALESVREASSRGLDRLKPSFRERLRHGFVRECHGDLHLENLALVDGRVLPFDGVEFQPAFRWVDVASDLAFLLMDLRARGFEPLANRLLDRYLQRSGDYGALAVLRFYLMYRAMVRAKVAAIRSTQRGETDGDFARQANALIGLAAHFAAPPCPPWLAITHGLSGSGKSRLAGCLAVVSGAVCLRSDVERARRFPDDESRYTPAASRETYAALRSLARQVLDAGYPAIVDATFLDAAERRRFQALAANAGRAFRILSLDAPRAVLERRVAHRAEAGTDASQADTRVLAAQYEHAEPLTPEERAFAIDVDDSSGGKPHAIARWLREAA